jgi:hypothetical protein
MLENEKIKVKKHDLERVRMKESLVMLKGAELRVLNKDLETVKS